MEHYKNLSLENIVEVIDGITYTEEWRDIIGYEGLYMVSSFGRVKSLPKLRKHREGYTDCMLPEMIMVWRITNRGYLRVGLTKDGKQKFDSAHRLVGKHFIPNPENKPTVNHRWGNKFDNRSFALEWFTYSEQQLHSNSILGNVINKKGAEDSQSKSVYQIGLDGRVIEKFGSIREAVRRTGIPKCSISNCANGKFKTGKGFYWSFDQTEPLEKVA